MVVVVVVVVAAAAAAAVVTLTIGFITLRYYITNCILPFIPCLENYSQSEARIAVAYSAVCNGQYATGNIPLYFPVITCAQ